MSIKRLERDAHYARAPQP